MIQQEVTITNPSGLHARPAAQFVKLANTFQAAIQVVARGKSVNAKSMLEMMSAGAARGDRILIKAEGPDETQAVQALTDLLAHGLVE